MAAKLTVRGALNHPFAFGWREGAAVVRGAVASYLSANDVLPAFPAWSRHVPATAAVALSGPEKLFVGSHESSPDVASPPEKLTVSGAVYQPAAFAGRLGAAVTCGAVASYLSGREPASLFPALSRHEPLTVAAEASGPA